LLLLLLLLFFFFLVCCEDLFLNFGWFRSIYCFADASEFPLSSLEYIAFASRETGQGRVVAKYSGGTVYFTTNFMCIQTFGGPENAPKYSGETTVCC
jgi:hypothetical protein